jgi:hypothetical protein
MSIMMVSQQQQRMDWVRVISRKKPECWEWPYANLDETEYFSVLDESDGLALRIVILSIRAEELLTRLHREVFAPTFAMPTTRVEEDGARSAWFGFSEPTYFSRYYVA